MGQRSIHDMLAELAARIDTTTELGRDEARRVEELRLAATHLELAMAGEFQEGPGEVAARVALSAWIEVSMSLRRVADEVHLVRLRLMERVERTFEEACQTRDDAFDALVSRVRDARGWRVVR